jgi:hypothetical protein
VPSPHLDLVNEMKFLVPQALIWWVCSWKSFLKRSIFIVALHKCVFKIRIITASVHFPYFLNAVTLHLLGFGREWGVPNK